MLELGVDGVVTDVPGSVRTLRERAVETLAVAA